MSPSPKYDAISESDENESLNKERFNDDEESVDHVHQNYTSGRPATSWNEHLRTAIACLGWVLTGVLGVVLLLKLGSTTGVSTQQPLMSVKAQRWNNMENLFFFGDSYTATFTSENYSPPWGLEPLLMQNGKYRTKPNWAQFLTETYNTSVVRTVNLAVGGSTVDNDLVTPFLMGTSLKQQSNDMIRRYGPESGNHATNWQSHNTLFIIWLGVNDVALTHMRSIVGEKHNRPPLPVIFESYRHSIENLHAIGARNFLFLTVPPVDRSHSPVPVESWEVHEKLDETADIAAFNARIFELRDVFNHEYDDISASVFDAHRFFSRVLDGPQDFAQTVEVTNTTGICDEKKVDDEDWFTEECKTDEPTRYYAWTGLHATFPLHNATAAVIVEDCLGAEGKRGFCI